MRPFAPPAWALPTFLALVWGLWVVAGVAGAAARDAREPLPGGRRRGFSFAPVVPVFPLVAWGLAWLGDWAAWPVGTVGVGAAHAILAIGMMISLGRDLRYLRSAGKKS